MNPHRRQREKKFNMIILEKSREKKKKMTMEPSEEAKPTRSSPALIPGLPDDLALLCLARLPSRCRATAAVTSTAWKAALSPSSIDPVRRTLSLPSEAWLYLFLVSTTTTRFFFLDLLYRRLVPFLPPDIPSAYHVLPRQAASTTTHFFLLLYNTITSSVLLLRCSGAGNPVSWTTTTVPTPHFSLPLWPTCIGLNSRLFIAGGCDFSRTTGVVRALDDGEEWHQLPSLNHPRFMAAGLVHKGKIWVVGGRKMTSSGMKMVDSGEFYQEGEWKMVPGMWPEALHVTLVSVSGRVGAGPNPDLNPWLEKPDTRAFLPRPSSFPHILPPSLQIEPAQEEEEEGGGGVVQWRGRRRRRQRRRRAGKLPPSQPIYLLVLLFPRCLSLFRQHPLPHVFFLSLSISTSSR